MNQGSSKANVAARTAGSLAGKTLLALALSVTSLAAVAQDDSTPVDNAEMARKIVPMLLSVVLEADSEVGEPPACAATFSPSPAAEGAPVTVCGQGFTADSTVSVGGQVATAVEFVSATELRFFVPDFITDEGPLEVPVEVDGNELGSIIVTPTASG